MASPVFVVTFLLVITITTTTNISSAATTTTTTTAKTTTLKQGPLHFNDNLTIIQIINFLNETDHFKKWSHILSSTFNTNFTLPPYSTLFVPTDKALMSVKPVIDPFLVSKHIVPVHLTFSSLLRHPIGSHIPTLLPNYTLLVTNNSVFNFTVNGATIQYHDLYRSTFVSVHGVGSLLSYNRVPSPPVQHGTTVFYLLAFTWSLWCVSAGAIADPWFINPWIRSLAWLQVILISLSLANRISLVLHDIYEK